MSDVTMIILGLDPGTARLGYGVLRKEGARLLHVEHGCLETPKDMTQAARLLELQALLESILRRHAPTLVGVERLFFQKNAKTAMSVAEARGVALAAVQASGATVSEHTPMQVKLAVTGHGGADKRQVQQMVRTLLKLDELPEPDDAADALAIAYAAATAQPPDFLRKHGISW